MPPKAPPRRRRPHTRANPANHLYAGLEHNRVAKIKFKPYRVLRKVYSDFLPPVPTLIPRPSVRQARTPPPPAYVQAGPPVVSSRLLNDVLNQPGSGDCVFSHLNVSDYQSLRCSRLLATTLPAYTPSIHFIDGNGGRFVDVQRLTQGQRPGHINSGFLDLTCEDRCLHTRRRGPAAGYSRLPWTPWNWWLLPKDPLYRCPDMDEPLNGWSAREFFKNCDGTRLGLNTNNGHHPKSFTICAGCARMNYWFCDPTRYFHGRILALCYNCSETKINSPDWTECQCREEYDPCRIYQVPNPGPVHLCAKCRIAFSQRQENECQRKCHDLNLIRTGPYPSLPNGHYINDALRDRGYCLCGKNSQEILDSYPLDRQTNHPDLAGMFRMCLICDKHVSRVDTSCLPTNVPM